MEWCPEEDCAFRPPSRCFYYIISEDKQVMLQTLVKLLTLSI